MTTSELVLGYFDALQRHDGAAVRALFDSAGTIDDLKGNHHAGGEAIQTLIDSARGLSVELVSDVIHEPPRATVYGRIQLNENGDLLQIKNGETLQVRWVFTVSKKQILYLCNSHIMSFPQERLSNSA